MNENIKDFDDKDVLVDGIPTMALLPAKRFKFKVLRDVHKIVVPNSGNYAELDNKFFSKEDGDFDIFNSNNVFDASSLTKLLFAAKKYPDLNDNELFCPTVVRLYDDNVVIYGKIIIILSDK